MTVASGLHLSHTARSNSHPALVDKVYWKGAVAASTCLETCFAMVLATSLQTISPTTIPLTPPSGFFNAVTRPNLMPSKIGARRCRLPTRNPPGQTTANRLRSPNGLKSSQTVLLLRFAGIFANAPKMHRRPTETVQRVGPVPSEG